MSLNWRTGILSLGMIVASACSSDDKTGVTPGNGDDAGAGGDDDCVRVVKDADCDKTKRPFVFVHGTYGSGDNIAHVASLFGSNGYCQDRFVAVEYNSVAAIGDPTAAPLANLDALIDDILEKTGMDKVELAGHSQGTLWATTYLQDPNHAAKVAHYINYSGSNAVLNDVPTLSLSSQNDLQGTTHHATGSDVKVVTLVDEDHFAVAASTNSFIETWKYLYDADPKYTEIQCGDPEITIEGVSETFADNVPVAGKAEIYELPGEPRAAGTNPIVNTASANGHFGPIKLKRNVPYELKGYDGDGKLVGYQYFTPFKRSNHLVRLLIPSGNALVASATTDNFVRKPRQVDVVVRYAPGAFRADLGDSLKVDGNEVLTNDNAGKAASVVGLFMYDKNENDATDLGQAFSAPFVVGTDVYMSAASPKYIELNMNGQTLKVANWPASEALINVMFQ